MVKITRCAGVSGCWGSESKYCRSSTDPHTTTHVIVDCRCRRRWRLMSPAQRPPSTRGQKGTMAQSEVIAVDEPALRCRGGRGYRKLPCRFLNFSLRCSNSATLGVRHGSLCFFRPIGICGRRNPTLTSTRAKAGPRTSSRSMPTLLSLYALITRARCTTRWWKRSGEFIPGLAAQPAAVANSATV